MCIAVGVFAAVWLAGRRWMARGGEVDDVPATSMFAVPAGVIGARIYHVATDWKSYRGHWGDALKIWDGGLGIWGGVALGTIVGLIVGRRRRLNLPRLMEAAAPAIPLAQAIGRIGNWFNIELFGGPTKAFWALEVPQSKRPEKYANFATFHPTFLYELLWNLLVVAIVLSVEKRYSNRLKPGRLFAVYVAAYTFGRFWIERIRVDNAYRLLDLRVNELVAASVFVIAAMVIVTGIRRADDATQVDSRVSLEPNLNSIDAVQNELQQEHVEPQGSAGAVHAEPTE
jgi:prolipoprotein diacylglyceryl transferase